MELATALHHSAQRPRPVVVEPREEAGHETYCGLRAPMPLPPGTRPAPLSEVAGPQRCDRTVRGTSLGAPPLAAPQLAANETLDSAALSFLLNRALEEKEKEEEERVKREEEQVKRQEALLTRLQAERDVLLVLGLGALSSKQKKRLNAVLGEREAILDRRERRRVVAKRKKKRRRTRKSRCTW